MNWPCTNCIVIAMCQDECEEFLKMFDEEKYGDINWATNLDTCRIEAEFEGKKYIGPFGKFALWNKKSISPVEKKKREELLETRKKELKEKE